MPDFYKNIREFTGQLETAGFSAWASKLTDAIDAGSTGSEILMAVRWNLQELLRNEVDLPSALKLQAEGFIQEITSSGV